ncbi:2-dehydropantoate 2-reductase [Shouchella shacheensis]|uniref:2-dehydropantoate 2-reductase n=1 Tax=Shouchella shacheensis TaxID=1649580 RepID=UPI00074027EC|nr:2-dehydropantoate 2-reductase [Shouchella shacheensis]
MMKVAVVGAGAVGMAVAAFFAKAGAEVHVWTRRQAQARALNQEGIAVFGERRLSVAVKASEIKGSNKAEEADLMIVAVKSYHLPEVLDVASFCLERARSTLFLQNGMGHLVHLERLRVQELNLGTTEHGVTRISDVSIQLNGVGNIRWAPYRGGGTEFRNVVNQVSNECFPYQEEPSYKRMLEYKLVANACINGLTALCDVKNGALIENGHLNRAMKDVFLEVIAVLERTNEQKELWEYVEQICQSTAANTSSMLADKQEGRRMEIDGIYGFLVCEGDWRGVDTPILSLVMELLQSKESEGGEKPS